MVTVQSATCQPWIPCVRVSFTVSDRLEERVRHRSELDLQPELHPEPTYRRRSTRRPTVARRH